MGCKDTNTCDQPATKADIENIEGIVALMNLAVIGLIFFTTIQIMNMD